jgi:anti-anti-sigma factor
MSEDIGTVTIDSRAEGDDAIVTVAGELDPHTAPLLERALDDAASAAKGNVIVDVAGLTFIDSSGLRVVLGARRSLVDQDRHLLLRSPSDTVQRLLDIVGLSDYVEIDR